MVETTQKLPSREWPSRAHSCPVPENEKPPSIPQAHLQSLLGQNTTTVYGYQRSRSRTAHECPIICAVQHRNYNMMSFTRGLPSKRRIRARLSCDTAPAAKSVDRGYNKRARDAQKRLHSGGDTAVFNFGRPDRVNSSTGVLYVRNRE